MTPRYEHQAFPAWRYHSQQPPQLVPTAEAAAALGPDWAETPAETVKSKPKGKAKDDA